MHAGKILGDGIGALVGGLSYVGSAARGARVFHPQGVLYSAQVEVAPAIDLHAEAISKQLLGLALVRMSAGLWKGQREWPDILGVAIRFGWKPHAPLQTEGVQDLLLLTAKRFWTFPIALLVTETADFLDNVYYSILPFQSEAGEIEFRLVPQPGRRPGGRSRSERLADAVSKSEAVFTLQMRPVANSSVPHDARLWQSLATIQLLEKIHLDEQKLLFTPFHAGRGIRPAGLANRVRRLTYRMSKAGRLRY